MLDPQTTDLTSKTDEVFPGLLCYGLCYQSNRVCAPIFQMVQYHIPVKYRNPLGLALRRKGDAASDRKAGCETQRKMQCTGSQSPDAWGRRSSSCGSVAGSCSDLKWDGMGSG